MVRICGICGQDRNSFRTEAWPYIVTKSGYFTNRSDISSLYHLLWWLSILGPKQINISLGDALSIWYIHASNQLHMLRNSHTDQALKLNYLLMIRKKDRDSISFIRFLSEVLQLSHQLFLRWSTWERKETMILFKVGIPVQLYPLQLPFLCSGRDDRNSRSQLLAF